MSFKRKRPGDWGTLGDGFEGLDVDKPQVKRQKDRGLPGARRLYTSKNDVNDDPIEEIISWTSSEEENEDSRSQQRTASRSKKVKVSSTEKRASVRTKQEWKQSSCPEEEEVTVVCDSDDSTCNSSVDRLKMSEPVGESIEFDIECEDSRSSILTQPSESQNDTQVTCTSPCISQATSASTSQSHSPDQGGKVKASQWVKMLDLKTPTKNSQDVTFPELEDSAKKKKKYKRGGLADQLSSLKGRERSHISMVRHQQSTTPRTPQPADTGTKSLSLKILRLEPLFSLQLAHCIQEEGESLTEQLVLFLYDQSLQEGNSVQVFAPWQQIRLKHTSELVLLCSNYCITPPKDQTETMTLCQTDTRSKDSRDVVKVINGVWKCPCVSGLVFSPTTCPAHLNPGIPGLFSSKSEKDSEEGDDQLSALATIPATQSASVRTRLTKSSVLEWVDCHDPSTRLQGRVLRVFCFNTKGSPSEKRYSILIEDSHGTMCQIFCPEDAEMRFPSVLQRGEGLIHVFGGITVQCRATRDREPALFSVIDRLWSDKCVSNTGSSTPSLEESTAGSEESNSISQFHRTSAPAFCYVMKEAASEGGMVIRPIESDSSVVKERITRLAHLGREDQERVSVCCTVILSLNMSEVKDSLPRSDVRRSHRSILYVRDSSDPKYVTMTTIEGFCLPELNEMRNKTWMFRDVTYHLGKMACDKYSCVILQNTESVTSCDLDLLPINAESSVLDLYSVSGTVCGVDENSAYSWEVCDRCQQENLAQDTSSQQLVCLSCKEVVRKPQTRMKLVVFLSGTSKCDSTPVGHVTQPLPPESKVSVELLQSSIEELLPDASQTQEGYDMACVLGQKMGPLTCVVLKCKPSEVVLKEVSVDPQK
nr:DNA repair-scaffolding protein isoform X1 [Crassostrea gigas]XP_011417582.2 DNA repair-scaffolding protein isoform X1 [Crassostrea gigas]